MITFLLSWCALSVVSTIIALAMIRAGKRRQPQAGDYGIFVGDSFSANEAPHKHGPMSSAGQISFNRAGLELPLN